MLFGNKRCKVVTDTLQTLFGHILNVEEDLIRERAIKFLAVKLKLLPETVVTKPIEEFILQESKKVCQCFL